MKMKNCHFASLLALGAGFALLANGAEAQHRAAPDFHGRDFGHFSRGDVATWRGGHWVQDWHDGRFAWWWVVDPFWYFYPAPVYPYPTYVPPAIVVQQAPPAPAGMPPEQYWYYCDNPQGYYPYVASCNTAWRGVPVTPQPAPASPSMPAPQK